MLPTINLLVHFLLFLKFWRGLFTIMSSIMSVNIISPLQFGFLPSCSPVKQLLTLISVIDKSFENNDSVDCI